MAKQQLEYKSRTFTCSCGSSYSVRTTLKQDTHVEICSSCHPFYTKKQKLVDSAGRVERFKQKFGAYSAKKPAEQNTDSSE